MKSLLRPLLSLLLFATPICFAQTLTVLGVFDGTNGSISYAPPVQGLDGNFYGTTWAGGASGSSNFGTVFKVTPSGGLSAIYSFCPQGYPSCPDGEGPIAGLVLGTDGNFYGTTAGGGDPSCNVGCGTAFKVSPEGMLTPLHAFTGAANGSIPNAALIEAADGYFYGSTFYGGEQKQYCGGGCGTIFKLSSEGRLLTLYDFPGGPGAGATPFYPLMQGADGNLYGTTWQANNWTFPGIAFRVTERGSLSVLYNFCSKPNCEDGTNPSSALIQATDGNFYGSAGGGTLGWGTVYKLTPEGVLTTLHSFCNPNDCTNGSGPGGLVQATDGNFYGVAGGGSNKDAGILFRISANGRYTKLYDFCSQTNCADGSGPNGPLVQGTDGNFYGTTVGGGYVSGGSGGGTVFKFSVGLGPFIKTLPPSGKVGTPVFILGNNLTGATSVTFNRIPAMFTVVSDTEITATVPTGATTGKVDVNTPSGELSSNIAFRVR